MRVFLEYLHRAALKAAWSLRPYGSGRDWRENEGII